MRRLRLVAAAATAALLAPAPAAPREIDVEVRGAPERPVATLFLEARRCIPFVSCSFEWDLLAGSGRFERMRWRRRVEARQDGEVWRLRVDPRPWTLGAYALEDAEVALGDGMRVGLHFGDAPPSADGEVALEHFRDQQGSGRDVGPLDALRRVVIEVRSRPTLASFLEGVFLARDDDGWRRDAARGRFVHASGATLAPADEENGFVAVRLPAGARVELPVGWEAFWSRAGEPAAMTVEHVVVAEPAMRGVAVTVLDTRSRAYLLGASPSASPVDRTLVVDAASWARLRGLPPAPGVEVEVVRREDGTPRALAIRAEGSAPAPLVVCVAAWHGPDDPRGPACARIVVR